MTYEPVKLHDDDLLELLGKLDAERERLVVAIRSTPPERRWPLHDAGEQVLQMRQPLAAEWDRRLSNWLADVLEGDR